MELLEILKSNNLTTQISYSDWRPADQKAYVSDIKKAKQLGWKPKFSPEKGTTELIEWVQENRKIFM